jgi:hypothetical protein
MVAGTTFLPFFLDFGTILVMRGTLYPSFADNPLVHLLRPRSTIGDSFAFFVATHA